MNGFLGQAEPRDNGDDNKGPGADVDHVAQCQSRREICGADPVDKQRVVQRQQFRPIAVGLDVPVLAQRHDIGHHQIKIDNERQH